jgi:hypothetical protein
MTKRNINFFFAKCTGIREQLYFHGHDSRRDCEFGAFHCFNGATEVRSGGFSDSGLNITTRVSKNTMDA